MAKAKGSRAVMSYPRDNISKAWCLAKHKLTYRPYSARAWEEYLRRRRHRSVVYLRIRSRRSGNGKAGRIEVNGLPREQSLSSAIGAQTATRSLWSAQTGMAGRRGFLGSSTCIHPWITHRATSRLIERADEPRASLRRRRWTAEEKQRCDVKDHWLQSTSTHFLPSLPSWFQWTLKAYAGREVFLRIWRLLLSVVSSTVHRSFLRLSSSSVWRLRPELKVFIVFRAGNPHSRRSHSSRGDRSPFSVRSPGMSIRRIVDSFAV